VLAVSLNTVQSISQYRIKLPNNLKQVAERNSVYRSIGEVLRRCPDGPPLLDPVKNQGIQDKSFKDLVKVRFFVWMIAGD
jgi:ATP-dependent RNA helicase DOB1